MADVDPTKPKTSTPSDELARLIHSLRIIRTVVLISCSDLEAQAADRDLDIAGVLKDMAVDHLASEIQWLERQIGARRHRRRRRPGASPAASSRRKRPTQKRLR